jgi:hypothetical protein
VETFPEFALAEKHIVKIDGGESSESRIRIDVRASRLDAHPRSLPKAERGRFRQGPPRLPGMKSEWSAR